MQTPTQCSVALSTALFMALGTRPSRIISWRWLWWRCLSLDWLEICPLGHQSPLSTDHGKQQKCKISLLRLDASFSLFDQGRGIFASGSPFSKVTLPNGQTFFPGQGNNAYVFPGVALGVIACGVRHISDDIFLITAEVSNWHLTNIS